MSIVITAGLDETCKTFADATPNSDNIPYVECIYSAHYYENREFIYSQYYFAGVVPTLLVVIMTIECISMRQSMLPG